MDEFKCSGLSHDTLQTHNRGETFPVMWENLEKTRLCRVISFLVQEGLNNLSATSLERLRYRNRGIIDFCQQLTTVTVTIDVLRRLNLRNSSLSLCGISFGFLWRQSDSRVLQARGSFTKKARSWTFAIKIVLNPRINCKRQKNKTERNVLRTIRF